MILTVGNIKGGVGKTTLAVHLAVLQAKRGRRVLLINADDQGTALQFAAQRAERLGEVEFAVESHDLAQSKARAAVTTADYEDVVVDAGGTNNASLRGAMTICDCLLIPVQPRSFDVWAFAHMAELVTEVQAFRTFTAVAVLNLCDPRGQDNAQARAALGQGPIGVWGGAITRRKAFSNATAQGLIVNELKPKDPLAVAEIAALSEAMLPAEDQVLVW